MKSLAYDSSPWIDLAEAKMALRDFAGAKAALDSAEKALFVNKAAVEKARSKLNTLLAKQRSSTGLR